MIIVGNLLKYVLGSIISSITYYAVNNAWTRLTDTMKRDTMPLDPNDGDAVENTESTREILSVKVLDMMNDGDIREIAGEYLEKLYESDEEEFQHDWKEYITDARTDV